jgi:hypothetical protein
MNKIKKTTLNFSKEGNEKRVEKFDRNRNKKNPFELCRVFNLFV